MRGAFSVRDGESEVGDALRLREVIGQLKEHERGVKSESKAENEDDKRAKENNNGPILFQGTNGVPNAMGGAYKTSIRVAVWVTRPGQLLLRNRPHPPLLPSPTFVPRSSFP